jgi:hypothetical protein
MAELDAHQPSEAEASSPRVRRTLELAYAVEGVVAVRIWRWGQHVAIGVLGSAPSSADLVRRVEAAVAGLKEPGELWDFGLLEEPSGDRSAAST